MSTRRRVLTLPLAGALCLALLASGCGGDDDGSDEGTGTPTTQPATSASSTESTTESLPSSTEATTAPDTTDGKEGSGEPEAEAEDVTWELNAVEYRDRVGIRVAFACPAGGDISSVWGTDIYTDDSSVCSAAVHAGLITVEDGGRVLVEVLPGEQSYVGTEANGVTSQDYGAWDGSFSFPPA